MSYEELLEKRIIEPVEISSEETADLLRVVRRDIRTAKSLITMDLDWAFAIAYNAVLQLTIAWMNSLGYRPRGEAKHMNAFIFLEETLPEERQPMIKRLQRMRRKRNATVYRQRGLVSEKEALDVIEFAIQYYRDIETLLPARIISLSVDDDN